MWHLWVVRATVEIEDDVDRPASAMVREPTDFELLVRSSSDAAAFRQLYDRYSGPLEAFFRLRTGGTDDALDLTAETFAAAWLSRDRVEDRFDGYIGPWLFGIGRNVLRRSARSAAIEHRALDRLGVALPSERAEAPTRADWLDGLDEDLAAALAALPRAHALAVVLRVVEGLPYDDVGAALGVSPMAARIKVSRGLATMRARLTEQHEEDRHDG
jgi:RNA polymerase sigma-70 factor, ECF subfamily